MKIEVIPLEKKYKHFLEYHPPVKANKILPEWYKKLNLGTVEGSYFSYVDGRETGLTAKNCPAIQDIVSTGFIIPLWSDFAFDTVDVIKGDVKEKRQSWYFTAPDAVNEKLDQHLTYHDNYQIGEMDIGTEIGSGKVLKITLPYRFKVPKGYNIMYTDPFYHFRRDIRCLSGLVEADKWGSVTFPFSIEKEKFFIKAGTPLVHCFLYKRSDVNFQLNVRLDVTEKEEEHMNKMIFHIANEHKHYKEISYEEE